MSRLNLWLVRHGQTEVNSGIWTASPEQTQLTPFGKEQAKHAAAQVDDAPDLLLVSPLIRAIQTMQFISNRWPDTCLKTIPIEEFMYLSPSKLANLNAQERKEAVNRYWLKADPFYCDGEDSESFATFLQRVNVFYKYIMQREGFVIVVGHGQFIKAFIQALKYGFSVSSEWMRLFREQETSSPIKNGEIIKLDFD